MGITKEMLLIHPSFYFQCDRTDSLQSYFEAIKSDEIPLIALLGCGCSPATEPVAEISFYSNIVHVSLICILMHMYVTCIISAFSNVFVPILYVNAL